MKILIADDELRLRKVIALYMTKCGYEIIEAGNGEAAVELAKEHKPDAIVLDVMMPGLNGIEAAETIRKMPEFAKTPIILLTANASENDVNFVKKQEDYDDNELVYDVEFHYRGYEYEYEIITKFTDEEAKIKTSSVNKNKRRK